MSEMKEAGLLPTDIQTILREYADTSMAANFTTLMKWVSSLKTQKIEDHIRRSRSLGGTVTC